MICTLVKAIADKFTGCASNNCAHDWVGKCFTKAQASTLDGASHRSFCREYLVHFNTLERDSDVASRGGKSGTSRRTKTLLKGNNKASIDYALVFSHPDFNRRFGNYTQSTGHWI
jgi:hypothetical protein